MNDWLQRLLNKVTPSATDTSESQGESDFKPHIPEVDLLPNIEARFAEARQMAAGGIEGIQGRGITIVTPGRLLAFQPCPPPGSVSTDMVTAIEKIVPSTTPLNVTVIALNSAQASTSPSKLARAIPFLGYLMGMGFLGHAVTVFEGHPSAFAAGCHEADLLIVDEAMIPFLQKDWIGVAYSVMRTARILIFKRNGTVQQIVKRT